MKKFSIIDNLNIQTTTNGVLNVCLCNDLCSNKESLKKLVDNGHGVLLYIRNNEDMIVHVTESMFSEI